MGKQIMMPIIWEIQFKDTGDAVEVASNAHYVVESEGVEEGRACTIDISSIETQIKQAAKDVVLQQIKDKEEIV